MGLFGFLRRKDERAIPEPGSPEFDAAVQGSALPDSQSVSMGQPGWSDPSSADPSPGPNATEVEGPNQTIDASSVPGLQEKIAGILGPMIGMPNAGGFGGGISPPKQDPLDQIAHLDRKRDAGEITDAEFEAQKRKLLGE